MSGEIRAMGFPGRYIQGPGALVQLPQLVAELGGSRTCVLADATVRGALGARIDSAFKDRSPAASTAMTWLDFPGECSAATIRALAGQAAGCDTVIALGGG